MVVWVNLALLAIAINAVLIQTVVTEESPIRNVLRGLVLVITVFMLIIRRVVVPFWLVLLTLLSAALLFISGNTDQLSLIFVLLLAPALWSIGERALTLALLRAALLSFALVFVFLGLGITQNEVLVSSTSLVVDRERATFGTNGVPFFMNLAYSAASVSIYYAFRWRVRYRWIVVVAAVSAMFYFFFQTNGRGGLLALLVFCALAAAMPHLIRSTFFRAILAVQPLIYLAVAIWFASQRYSLGLNEALSYRPSLYGGFLSSVDPIDLVWSTTVKQSDAVLTVDNSYLHLLIGGGVIVFVAFCVIFASSVMRMARRGMALEIAFVSAAMAYASSESILLRIENIFVIFAWYLLLRYATRMGNSAAERPYRSEAVREVGRA